MTVDPIDPDSVPISDREKQRWHEAERAFDLRAKSIESHAGQIEAFSLAGYRTLGLAAFGGTAAILGFLSANWTRLSALPETLPAVNWMLALLFSSVLATLLSILGAYLSQVRFVAALYAQKAHYEYPYVEETPRSHRHRRFGSVYRFTAIGLAIVSAMLLVAAGVLFLGLVK